MRVMKKKGKPGRNTLCPCGSGLKFKQCCINKPLSEFDKIRDQYYRKEKIRLKNPLDIRKIRDAGKLVVDTLDFIEEYVQDGVTTDEINTLVHKYTLRNGAIPAPLNYLGFPKSVCVSTNEEICHGVPGKRVIKNGDIVNVDVTSILEGYFADASKMFFVGQPSADAKKIVNVSRECLKIGMEVVKPGILIDDIGRAIQDYAEGQGCSIVQEFVGHGVGFDFHEPPQILHYVAENTGIILVPGMIFTIEPMINLGGRELRVLDDKWTAVTCDGSLSAQFEQTILVTDTGYESLTPYDLSV